MVLSSDKEANSMLKEKIACIAGTPIDTKMGADKLLEYGYDAYCVSSSKDPNEEMLFQISSYDKKVEKIKQILDDIKKNDINKVLVYCNSLASAVDFDLLSKETGLKIVTPFDIYKKEALSYNTIGVIAANAVATSKIEKAYLDANNNISIMSIGMLSLVLSVEKGLSQKEIIEKHKLDELCEWFISNGAEAILLGCTHFPYFYDELQKISKAPIIDPTKKMIDLL